MSNSSSDSDSRSQASPSPAGRSCTRIFVWLPVRTKSAPRRTEWDKLNRDGKVKELTFTRNSTQRAMQSLVRRNFPGLEGADLTRLRLYRSVNRGSSLERAADNIPDGKELLHLFGQSASKRIYMFLRTQHSVQTLTATTATSTVATSTATLTSNTVITTSTATLTSSTVAPSAATPASNTVAIATSAATVQTSNMSVSLAAMPTSSTVVDTAAVNVSESGSTSNMGTINYLDNRDYDDYTNVTAACSRDWDTAGTIVEDLCPVGVFSKVSKVPYDQLDREHEVAWCENILFKECIGKNTNLPLFLNLTLSEMCHQAFMDKKVMTLIVLKEGDNLQYITRLLTSVMQIPDVYFWLAEAGSCSGKKVKDKYGKEGNTTELFVMVPTMSKPILVERYSGTTLQEIQEKDFVNCITRAIDNLTKSQSQLWMDIDTDPGEFLPEAEENPNNEMPSTHQEPEAEVKPNDETPSTHQEPEAEVKPNDETGSTYQEVSVKGDRTLDEDLSENAENEGNTDELKKKRKRKEKRTRKERNAKKKSKDQNNLA